MLTKGSFPQDAKPAEIYEPIGYYTDITHVGNAGGGPTPYIVNPQAITGHEYQVFFTQRQEIRNANGDWVPAGTVRRDPRPNDPDTLTGSSIDISAIYPAVPGTPIELHFSEIYTGKCPPAFSFREATASNVSAQMLALLLP